MHVSKVLIANYELRATPRLPWNHPLQEVRWHGTYYIVCSAYYNNYTAAVVVSLCHGFVTTGLEFSLKFVLVWRIGTDDT